MEAPLLSLPQMKNEKQIKFVNKHLKTENDLFHKSTNHITSSLIQQCSQLELHIHNLHNRLTKRTVSWISRSFYAKSAILKLIHTLQNEVDSERFQWVLNEELPRLADEMNRMESIRSYLETAVQLEALVGDLEDTALFVMARHTGNMFSVKLLNSSVCADTARKHDKLLQAIKAMNDIEEVMITILKFHPQWHCLTRSVDNRVNEILSALRPQVLSDHQALLVSLGWPPKLLSSKNGSEQVNDIPNPLVLMQEDKRRIYSRSCIALCALQHLRTRREERQLNFIKQEKDNIQLWAIDELVSPISSRMKCHFAKWIEQPEYMFALVYKVTRDFIIGIDDVLQPLVDKARLIRCSAKEAWVSAMVQSLSRFIEKNVFSLLAERYKVKHLKPDVISSWLHFIDLIIAFDKQMQSLVNLDISVLAEAESFEGLSKGMSVLSIFSDRHDWLKIWAKIEFKNACKTINTELKEEKAWVISNKYKSGPDTDSDYLLSTIEDHRAPPIAELSLKILWDVIQRCQTMPSILSRGLFIRSTAGRFLWYFFKILLLQFKAIELRPDNSDDIAMIKACGLINASKYILVKLQEWSDTVEFLEIKIAENGSGVPVEDDKMDNDCFFREEIRCLSEIETNWLVEIIVVVLRQFEMLSCEYVQTKDNFEEDKDDTDLVLSRGAVDLVVSTDLVEALDYLKSRLQIARVTLTTKDFLDLWRSIAEGLDHYISCSFATSEIRFSKMGISQFKADMQALVFIFQPYCALPQAFFPCINEILKLLELKKEEAIRFFKFLDTEIRPLELYNEVGLSYRHG